VAAHSGTTARIPENVMFVMSVAPQQFAVGSHFAPKNSHFALIF
jgi:hypothetical protein